MEPNGLNTVLILLRFCSMKTKKMREDQNLVGAEIKYLGALGAHC